MPPQPRRPCRCGTGWRWACNGRGSRCDPRCWSEPASRMARRRPGRGPESRAASPAPAAVRPSNRPQPRTPAPPQAGTILPGRAAGRADGGRVRARARRDPSGVRTRRSRSWRPRAARRSGRRARAPPRGSSGSRPGEGASLLPIATAAAMASAAAVARAIHVARNGRAGERAAHPGPWPRRTDVRCPPSIPMG